MLIEVGLQVTMTSTFLQDWRVGRALSIEELARRSGLSPSLISEMESGASDFTGTNLKAVAESLGCEPWRILAGPPTLQEFRTRLVAQMLRDVCVEAVTTFDDMGRLDELKRNIEAEEFWRQVAAHFEGAVEVICRASSNDPSAP